MPFLATQRPDELDTLVELMLREDVRSYLEIGLRRGETFEYVGQRLPVGSRMVGVDWPRWMGGIWETYERQRTFEACARLRRRAIEILFVEGNSRDPNTVRAVRNLGPYDFLLIDGDHTAAGVRADWENYGSMARIVAFHDIDAANWDLCQAKPWKLARHGVAALWAELKAEYPRHLEIKGNEPGMGLGVLWNP